MGRRNSNYLDQTVEDFVFELEDEDALYLKVQSCNTGFWHRAEAFVESNREVALCDLSDKQIDYVKSIKAYLEGVF